MRCLIFNRLNCKTLTIKGKIFSGSGEGTVFTNFPWVKEQIIKKIGFVPYPGTLNIKLMKEYMSNKLLLKRVREVFVITPVNNFCPGNCFKIYFNDLKCMVVIPKIKDYPENILEIIAPVNLRKTFNLIDGLYVEIKVEVQ